MHAMYMSGPQHQVLAAKLLFHSKEAFSPSLGVQKFLSTSEGSSRHYILSSLAHKNYFVRVVVSVTLV